MSSKRAKPETKRVPTNTVFTVAHLVAYICSFIPNAQLPTAKRTNKAIKLVLEKNVALDERRQRGVLEQYARLEWIRDRAGNIREKEPELPFKVCYKCKGYNENIDANAGVAKWLHLASANEWTCFPCEFLGDRLEAAKTSSFASVRVRNHGIKVGLRGGFVATDEDRQLVRNEQRYDPEQHLKELRKQFPYDSGEDDHVLEEADDGLEDTTDWDNLDNYPDSEEETAVDR